MPRKKIDNGPVDIPYKGGGSPDRVRNTRAANPIRGGGTLNQAIGRLKKQSSGVTYKRPTKRQKPRYGNKDVVDSGVRDRTISRYNRLKAMGVNPGLSQKQLDSGAGARKVKRLLRKQRDKKTTYSI